ncbi:DUF3726 domain-containing protein [Altererythrobacter sp. MF3-039]|uniref:DUF3726 domain-containing protein n=1 Tax=Altererythrobacter sp. MF3-039 TaxID=3252901 RepID=UPI00390C864B
MPGSGVNERHALSRNELLALLRRVFEAIFGKSCDYEAMAEQIAWLECHGLGGFDLLCACLNRLDNEEHPSDGLLIEASSADSVVNDLDAGGASLLCFGDVLADLLVARCADRESCRVKIANLREGQAIIPQLHRMALAGRFAAARITNPSNGTSWYAHVSSSAFLPVLSGFQETKDCGALVSLNVVCAANEHALQEAMNSLDPQWPEPTITPGQLADCNADCLRNGIPVSDLAALNAVADRILVEATEDSRRGAGE